MAPPVKVSVEQIRRAIEETGGNVERAAQILGIARNNLYDRLERAGLMHELETVRHASRTPDNGRGAKWRPIHVPREAWEQAREAAFDIAYHQREETRPEDVVRLFFTEAFGPWLERKIADLRERKA
jgi:hypothetical protein